MNNIETTSENDFPLASFDSEGIHLSSNKITQKLEKKQLSASLITGLQNCPAQWAFNSFVMPQYLKEHPDNAKTRGSMFHKVMEDFFRLKNNERTPQRMKVIVRSVLQSNEFSELAQYPDAVDWLKNAVNGYYNMGAKPQKVKVADIDIKGERQPGLEMFVNGKIGNTKRSIVGFVDRIVEDPRKGSDGVIIEDWKTSAKAKHWNPNTKDIEGLAEQRQQIIYTMLLKAQGVNVTGARLLYPVARDFVKVNLKDEKMCDRVVSDVEEADKSLTIMTETNTFEARPSFLCSWCPLVKVCKVANMKNFKKAIDARKNQPEPEEIMKGLDVR